MKIKKRIVSLFSVIIVCIPLIFMFPFTASADTYNPPKDVDISKAGYRYGDLFSYLVDNYGVSQSEFNKLSNDHVNAALDYQGNSYYFDIDINGDVFPLTVYEVLSAYSNLQSDQKIYFYSLCDNNNINRLLFVSLDFIYFNTTDSTHIYLESSSTIQIRQFTYSYKGVYHKYNGSLSLFSGLNTNIQGAAYYYSSSCQSYSSLYRYSSSSVQLNYDCFINGSGLSGYPNFLINPDMSGYIDASDFFDKPLSEQIEVTFTPSFGIGMDRIFDRNTGQNDYFKMNVTNNSNTNIQFVSVKSFTSPIHPRNKV